jgi:glycosyltransferase involved in cell wall biosynthesis
MSTILVLNHFPTIYPPNTGGVLRYFHIYNELSKFYDITLLSQKYTPDVEFIPYSATFREYKIPTDPIQHKIDKKLIKGGVGPRFSTHAALSCALLDSPPPTFMEYYDRYYKQSDMIIFESPFMLNHDKNFGLDTKPRIYNSHNLESRFASRIWYGMNSRNYVNHVTRMERKLVKRSTMMFATSREEKTNFIKAYNVDQRKIKLSPNGVIPEYWFPRYVDESNDKQAKVLFIGSMHQPNHQIVKFIITRLSKQCPSLKFIVAGTCCNKYSHLKIKNVAFLGEIDDEEKKRLFSTVDIAINPAFFGTGTKIKTLEFLSAGIPLISTNVGVNGMRLTKDVHYINASSRNFALLLKRSLQDKERLKKIALQGQQYVNQNYSWGEIAKKMRIDLDAL